MIPSPWSLLSAEPSEAPIFQSTVSVTPETVAEIATAISCALRPDPGLAESLITFAAPPSVAVPTNDIVVLAPAVPPYLEFHAAWIASTQALPALAFVVEAVADPKVVAVTESEPTVNVTYVPVLVAPVTLSVALPPGLDPAAASE